VGPAVPLGLCRPAGPTARMASLAACFTAGGPLRWSTQSCVPRLQVEHAVLRATPPVLAADGVRPAVPLGIVSPCRPGRPHGKPGGLLHCGRHLQVEHAVLRATPPVLAADGVGPAVPLGLCRPAGPTARMASLAACFTAGGPLRWSTQSCVPRRQSWRRLAFRTTGQPGCVSPCRPGRPHGKLGGMLRCGRHLEVEHAVLRATPPVLAAVGVPNYRTARVHVALPA